MVLLKVIKFDKIISSKDAFTFQYGSIKGENYGEIEYMLQFDLHSNMVLLKDII